MDDSFPSLISSARHILFVLPLKPYFDQIAAALSLYLSLSDRADIEVFCATPMSVGFNRLVGVNKIKNEIGNKNLSITFPGYDASNIDKVSYDIENGEFKLDVVPKTGFSAPEKEKINLSYSGVSADLVVLIGGADETHFPLLAEKDLEKAKIAHIGTRVLVGNSGRGIMSFAKPGSSVAELVALLIKENSFEMDVDIATNLLMGIEEGSNHFQSNEVTPETFEIFAYLLRAGGRRQPKKVSLGTFPPGAIPSQPFSPLGQSGQTKPVKQFQPISAQGGPAFGGQQEPVLEQVEGKEEVVENPPQDWLQPKIYKGTSVS